MRFQSYLSEEKHKHDTWIITGAKNNKDRDGNPSGTQGLFIKCEECGHAMYMATGNKKLKEMMKNKKVIDIGSGDRRMLVKDVKDSGVQYYDKNDQDYINRMRAKGII